MNTTIKSAINSPSNQSVIIPAMPEAIASNVAEARRRNIIVGAMMGGSGTTLTVEVMATVAIGQRLPLRVIAIDAVDLSAESEIARKSKLELALTFKNRKNLGRITVETQPLFPSGISVQDAFFNRQGMQFDALADALTEHDCLVDLGANVVDRFLDWLRTTDEDGVFLGGVELVLVVPLTNETVSIERAIGTLEKLRHLDKHRIEPIIVRNEVHGPLPNADHASRFQRLNDLIARSNGRQITLPRCRAYGFKPITGLTGGLTAAAELSLPQYQAVAGLSSKYEAYADSHELAKWTRDAVLCVHDIVVPQPR